MNRCGFVALGGTALAGSILNRIPLKSEPQAAVREIGYDGLFVLETNGRRGRFAEDTQASIDFTKNHFG